MDPKNTIRVYYFSGTGNSLYIARKLASQFSGCCLIPIVKDIQNNTSHINAEFIGFIFPLYFHGLPEIVLEYIKKIEIPRKSYIFVVITKGVPFVGGGLRQIQSLLKKKGNHLSAGFYILMVENYIPMFEICSEMKQQKLFKKAENKIIKIAKIIKNKKKRIERSLLDPLAPFIYNPWIQKIHTLDKNFFIEGQCTSCGICKNICPVNNIIMIDSKPIWQNRCQQCFACLHFCPERVIQWSKKTIERRRYHHPDITIRDIMAQK